MTFQAFGVDTLGPGFFTGYCYIRRNTLIDCTGYNTPLFTVVTNAPRQAPCLLFVSVSLLLDNLDNTLVSKFDRGMVLWDIQTNE